MEFSRISTLFGLVALGVGSVFSGCSNPTPNVSNLDALPLLGVDSLMLPQDYLGGDVVSMRRLPDESYLFSDYMSRALQTYRAGDEAVSQIGRHGEGPGEYRRPIYVRLGENGEIAFSDISNPLIKFILPDGSQTGVLAHTHGGGRKFDLLEDVIYVQSTERYLLYAYERTGDQIAELFPIDESYGRFAQRLSGGGVAVAGHRVFTMNSLEPRIYVYDVSTQRTSTLSPTAWKRYRANLDRDRVERMTLENWDQASDDFAVFMDLDKIILDNDNLLVTTLRYRGKMFLNILRLDGEVLYECEIDSWFVGSQLDLLFFVGVNEDTDQSTLLAYRYVSEEPGKGNEEVQTQR